MSPEIFRELVESPVEPQDAPHEAKPFIESEAPAGADKASEPLTKEEENLEIWEGLHRTKFVVDYFNIKEYANEFGLKMQTATIDKYIKGELENRKYEKNTENWKKVLGEIESEIGSNRLELFERIKKITGYIRALNRLNEAKKKKELYTSFMDS